MFKLCAVPGTEFNLSYKSLTSCEAWQAILDLHTTDPELYTEVTAGRHPLLPVPANEGAMPTPYDIPENKDVDHTVEEVQAVVLNVHTAEEVAQPLNNVAELEEE